MASYTAWGQRKALGRRYSQDPALTLESERLQQEYALIPQREARALQASQFDRSMAFNENQAALNRQAQEDANKQSATSGYVQGGVNALTTAATLRALTMEKGAPFFGNLFGAASSSPGVTGVTGTMAPSAITTGPTSLGLSQGVSQGLTYAPSSAATVTPALTDAGLSLAEGGVSAAGIAGADVGLAGGGAGEAATFGMGGSGASGAGATGGVTAGGAFSAVAPYAWIPAAATIGGMALESIGGGYDRDRNAGSGLARVGASLQNVWQGPGPTSTQMLLGDNYAGDATNALNTVQDFLNPGGFIARSVGCIIVTACTDRYSPEVEIARQYRDHFLDSDQLRGYYAIAEQVVPVLERNERVRKTVKTWLVDRLVEYGRYRLGFDVERPRWSSVAVSLAFLATIKAAGMILPEYVRANGEVY